MIKSMTGYASESFIINSTKFIVEIKSVNSKILDLNIRFPHFLKAYENDLRKEISNKLHRGKIELNVNSEIGANTDEVSINKEIINKYIQQLKQLNDINSDEKDYLKMAMRLPNAYSSKSIELNNTEINNIIDKISIVIKNLNNYRVKEGSEMEKDFRYKISVIKESRQDLEMISAYKEGYNALDQGDPFFAAKKFLEAELLFPQSEWAPRSALMASYSYYMQNYYAEAIANLERYLKTYPTDKNLAYAHYLIAMCYYETIEDEKRDSAPLIKAKNKFTAGVYGLLSLNRLFL